MFPRTNNRKAISTVLTTMIILVASVVLGTGVVLYGTSLFQTNASGEAISTSGTQVWVDSTYGSGWAWGAADVRNSGDKLLSIDQIQVRGQAVPFANWYANNTVNQITSQQYQAALLYTQFVYPVVGTANDGVLNNGTTHAGGVDATWAWTGAAGSCNNGGTGKMIMLLYPGQPICLSQQTGPVSLAPGQKAIIYFKIPQNLLTSVDAGSASSVALYAGKVGSPVSVTVAAK